MIKLIFLISALLLCNTYSSSVGESCTNSNECMQLNHCADSSNICVHDSIFPITFDTILGLIFVVFGSALSNAGGIGGGGLLIPILLLIFKFYTHEAIPISKLMIFSGAVTSFVLGFKQKHPFRDTITIDYNIPLLLVPMVLFGTMVGVTMNKVTPPWIILISLTLVLIINTYKTLQKGKALYLEEKRQLSSPRELGVLHEEDEHRSGGNDREHSRNEREKDKISDSVEIHEKSTLQCKETLFILTAVNTIEEYSLIRKEEIKDQRKCPFDKLIYMIICYVMMLLINFLKGSEHINSIIDIEV